MVPIPYWNGPYIDEWRQDSWGTNYEIYYISSECRVRSCGPDTDCGVVTDNIELFIYALPLVGP